MPNMMFNIHWVDSSCPFDDSKRGELYKEMIDCLTDDLVAALLNGQPLHFRFESSEFRPSNVRCFVVYDNFGNEVMGSCSGIDSLFFERNVIDEYVGTYPLIRDIFEYKSYLSESFPGFRYQPLDRNDPNYAAYLSFFEMLDEGHVLDENAVRYVFQKVMYRIVDQYDEYVVINPWERNFYED